MKKMIFVLIISISCLIFNGCQNNDNEYIENIKNISFNGKEIYFAKNVEDLAKNIFITWQYFAPVDKRDLKWSIEKTDKKEKSKIVKCEYRGNRIFFMTYYENGCAVDLDRSYTVSQIGWQNSLNEIAMNSYPALRHYFE